MKKIFRTLVFAAIAVIGSMTPSQYGLYNPKCPIKLKLKRCLKKKNLIKMRIKIILNNILFYKWNLNLLVLSRDFRNYYILFSLICAIYIQK